MAYSEFAYLYDDLNTAADYDALCCFVVNRLHALGMESGILADLGCGTGEMSLRLAKAGYDVLAVDASADMLTVLREKMVLQGAGAENPLTLRQDLAELDLYGTIQAAVSTFDTLNHLPPDKVRKAVHKVALFMEKGGVFLFDVNTPYKHREVLACNTFCFEDEGFACLWENSYLSEIPATSVTITARDNGEELFCESFLEYEYPQSFWAALLAETGFELLELLDGETLGECTPQTQRWLFVAQMAQQHNAVADA